MKNLKLSLKKEIISNLEAKEIKGGAPLSMYSPGEEPCDLNTAFCGTVGSGNNGSGGITNRISNEPTACLQSLPDGATCWECR